MADSMPEPLDHVLVQADLTVVAPGPLEPTLAADIAAVADVESAGSATVYRVTRGVGAAGAGRRAHRRGAARPVPHPVADAGPAGR